MDDWDWDLWVLSEMVLEKWATTYLLLILEQEGPPLNGKRNDPYTFFSSELQTIPSFSSRFVPYGAVEVAQINGFKNCSILKICGRLQHRSTNKMHTHLVILISYFKDDDDDDDDGDDGDDE